MPEIVCTFNNERLTPPALDEKSNLTIHKYGNIALFKILDPSKFKIFAFWKQSFHITQQNFLNIGHFGSFVKINHNVYWLLIKPPLLICTRESDPDAG